jgi:dTDP-4-dehydrorhamnose reductase
VRTAAFFSPDDPWNFAAEVARRLGAGHAMQAASDRVVSPTYVPDLTHAVLDLTIDGETGLWHLTNGEAMSWAEFGVAIAEALELDSRLIKPTPASQMGWTAKRPARVPLASERGQRLPALSKAIAHYAAVVREGRPLHPHGETERGAEVGWVA